MCFSLYKASQTHKKISIVARNRNRETRHSMFDNINKRESIPFGILLKYFHAMLRLFYMCCICVNAGKIPTYIPKQNSSSDVVAKRSFRAV
eukprot:jgi/Antlo1/1896/67